MEIVLKVRHLNDGHFQGGIGKLASCSKYPSFGTTLAIGKLTKKISEETMGLNAQYKKSFAEFLDEKGAPIPEKMENYNLALNDFMNTDIALSSDAGPFKKLKMSALVHVGLTPAELMILEPILDLTSAPLEAV